MTPWQQRRTKAEGQRCISSKQLNVVRHFREFSGFGGGILHFSSDFAPGSWWFVYCGQGTRCMCSALSAGVYPGVHRLVWFAVCLSCCVICMRSATEPPVGPSAPTLELTLRASHCRGMMSPALTIHSISLFRGYVRLLLHIVHWRQFFTLRPS